MHALADEPTIPDDYYSPHRVEMLLKQIPHFYSRQPLREGESPSGSRLWRNPVESRMAVMGDLLRAIESLTLFEERFVWSCLVYDQPYRTFAAEHGVSVGLLTKTKDRTIRQMARYLGWNESPD